MGNNISAAFIILLGKFPYLKLTEVTSEKKNTLMTRFVREGVDIKAEFEELIKKTTDYLENIGITLNDLRSVFKLSELVNSIEPADTVSDVMSKFTRNEIWTFFNYKFLASIINELCKDKAAVIAGLQNYEWSLSYYSRVQICEVPADIINCITVVNRNSLLYVNLDEKFTFSDPLNKIKEIQKGIGKLLKADLNLIKVGRGYGCVELTFRYFEQFEDIGLIVEHQVNDFTHLGVKSLQCDTYKLQMKDLQHGNNFCWEYS